MFDSNFRNSLNNLNNHFKRMTALSEVRGQVGCIKQGKKQILPPFAQPVKAEKVVSQK